MKISGAQRLNDGSKITETVWSEIERAVIVELIDLGTSYAISKLRSLTGGKVQTACRSRLACSRRDAAHFLQQEIRTPVVAVSKRFDGSYSGALTVILPASARLAITTAACVEGHGEESEMAALTRFSDVLLTQYLAEMESTLGLALQPEKVWLDQGFPYDVVIPNGAGLEDQLFVFSLEFGLDNQSATATLIAAVDRSSTDALKRYLHEFLDIDGGPDQTH